LIALELKARLKLVQRLEHGQPRRRGWQQQHTASKALDHDFGALEAAGLGQPDGLAAAG